MEWGQEHGRRVSSRGPDPYSIQPSSVCLPLLNLPPPSHQHHRLPLPPLPPAPGISIIFIPELRTQLHVIKQARAGSTVRQTWVQIPASAPRSCVSLEKSLNLSETRFPSP